MQWQQTFVLACTLGIKGGTSSTNLERILFWHSNNLKFLLFIEQSLTNFGVNRFFVNYSYSARCIFLYFPFFIFTLLYHWLDYYPLRILSLIWPCIQVVVDNDQQIPWRGDTRALLELCLPSISSCSSKCAHSPNVLAIYEREDRQVDHVPAVFVVVLHLVQSQSYQWVTVVAAEVVLDKDTVLGDSATMSTI